MKTIWYLLLLLVATTSYGQPANWAMLNGEQNANNLFIKDSLVFVARHNFNGISIVNLNQHSYNVLNQFNGKLQDDNVYQVLTDNQNRIWTRHLKGIAITTGNTTSYFTGAYFGVPDSPNVASMAIDQNQNVWLGFGHSLVKFNGQSFQVYNSVDYPMLGNWSGDLIIDNLNQLWLAANNNIIKYNGLTWHTYYGDSIGVTYPISNLRADKLGNLYFLEGGSRLKKFNNSTTSLIHYFNGDSYCNEIEVDSLNNLWALNLSFSWQDPALLLKRNNTGWDTIEIDNPQIIHGINHFVPVAANDIFLGTWEGIYRLNAGSYYHYLINDTLLTNGGVGKVITSNSSGKVWITSSRGLIEWQNNNTRHYKEKGKYFNDLPVNSFFADRHDSIWTSDYLNFCRYSHWQDSVWTVQCLDSTYPSVQIVFDTLNGIWTSPRYLDASLTTIIPLHYFNNDTVIYFPGVTSMNTLMAADSKNNLWVLQNDSLAKFDGTTWIWYPVPHQVAVNDPLPTFHLDNNDNVYINYSKTIVTFNGTGFNTITVPYSFALSNLAFSTDSSIWGVVSTQGQFTQQLKNYVLRYKNGVWDSLVIPVYNNDQVLIKDLTIDKFGNMWFVTNHDLSLRNTKLFVYNPTGLNHYLHTENLPAISESKIYPNPCVDFFAYTFNSAKAQKVLLRIYDLNGALVLEDGSQQSQAGNNILTYSVKNIRPGLYLAVVFTDNYHDVKKLFITPHK